MDDTLTIELAAPLEFANTSYDKLVLREPTVGEMQKSFAKDGGLIAAILLISLVTDIPRGAIEKLPMSAFKKASDFLGHFTEDSPETSLT